LALAALWLLLCSLANATVIDDKYKSLGGPGGFLGLATTIEVPTPNGLGSYRHFEHGSIYYINGSYFAFEVHGAIRDAWAAIGWENSPLGFPLSDEEDVPGVAGARRSRFERGVIDWTSTTGAHEIHGAIYQRWNSIGGEQTIGLPLTNESGTPDGRGRYNHFERGSIYWTATTGAWEVLDGAKQEWASQGWEQGPLGYPLAREFEPVAPGTVFQDFEHGYLAMQGHGAFPKTVLWTNAIFNTPPNVINWQSFGAQLSDGDRISAVVSAAGSPYHHVVLTLTTGPNVAPGFWKAAGVWSVTGGWLGQAQVTGPNKSSSITILPAQIEQGTSFVVFSKGKFFNAHTDMYWLAPTRYLLGHDATFTWTKD
jgi:uncharacterized protein with LGFP repeats